MSFQTSLPVRFQDVDAAGVLFYGRIYDYCHQAYEELIASSGVDPAHYFSKAEYLVPIVHSEADYKTPILHGERITVSIDVTRVGRASFRLRYRVRGPGEDVRVEVTTVHAFANRATMKPIPIPGPLRAFFLGHLVEEVVPDHAPK